MPSHYLNQCRNIVNWTYRNKLQWNFNPNIYFFIQENAFENVWKVEVILSRPQCVKMSSNKLSAILFRPLNVKCHSQQINRGGLEQTFYLMKMHLKTSSAKYEPFCFRHRRIKCLLQHTDTDLTRVSPLLSKPPSILIAMHSTPHSKPLHLGWGLLNQFPPFHYFPGFFFILVKTLCRRWKWWCWGSRRHNEMIMFGSWGRCWCRKLARVCKYRQDATQAGVYIIFNNVKKNSWLHKTDHYI